MENNLREPTMADVARVAGVSTMTVSRALKGDGTVTKKTHARVNKAVQQLGYVLNQSAGALSSNRTGFVTVLIPSLDNSNLAETLHGITESLNQNREQILLGYTNYSLTTEEELIATMLQRRPDGIIVTGGIHTQRARELLKNAKIPVVEMWDLPENPVNHVVGFSNSEAVEGMVSHLHHKGYRNIAFVGGDETADFRGIDRRRGYERAIKKLSLTARVISMGKPPIRVGHGRDAFIQLIEEWPEVEAVICVSDLSAFGIVMECKRRNWDVPKKLAVAGFGDFQISQYCFPSLTTTSVNPAEMGREAGKLLLEAIAAKREGKNMPPKVIKIPHSIIAREST